MIACPDERDAGEANIIDVMYTLKKCCTCNGGTAVVNKPLQRKEIPVQSCLHKITYHSHLNTQIHMIIKTHKGRGFRYSGTIMSVRAADLLDKKKLKEFDDQNSKHYFFMLKMI